MEGVSATMYKGFRGYWKKRGYERLNGSGRKRTKMARVELGSTRRRRFWKIKITPKLRLFKGTSPKNFFVWHRDAYAKMMMGFATRVWSLPPAMVGPSAMRLVGSRGVQSM
ncbi:hypothetical protein FCV25MIE_22642 [Fagus crenata]